jgi:hypothetical protein
MGKTRRKPKVEHGETEPRRDGVDDRYNRTLWSRRKGNKYGQDWQSGLKTQTNRLERRDAKRSAQISRNSYGGESTGMEDGSGPGRAAY